MISENTVGSKKIETYAHKNILSYVCVCVCFREKMNARWAVCYKGKDIFFGTTYRYSTFPSGNFCAVIYLQLRSLFNIFRFETYGGNKIYIGEFWNNFRHFCRLSCFTRRFLNKKTFSTISSCSGEGGTLSSACLLHATL